MSNDCLFCRIARMEIPAKLVGESERAIAFADIDPKAPVHFLVIPREHVESLDSVEDESLLGELLALAARLAREQGIAEDGYRVVANTNAAGGQTVFHLHLHVLGGRAMRWPPG